MTALSGGSPTSQGPFTRQPAVAVLPCSDNDRELRVKVDLTMTMPWSRSAAPYVIVEALSALRVPLRMSTESASGPRLLFEPTSGTPHRTQQKEV